MCTHAPRCGLHRTWRAPAARPWRSLPWGCLGTAGKRRGRGGEREVGKGAGHSISGAVREGSRLRVTNTARQQPRRRGPGHQGSRGSASAAAPHLHQGDGAPIALIDVRLLHHAVCREDLRACRGGWVGGAGGQGCIVRRGAAAHTPSRQAHTKQAQQGEQGSKGARGLTVCRPSSFTGYVCWSNETDSTLEGPSLPPAGTSPCTDAQSGSPQASAELVKSLQGGSTRRAGAAGRKERRASHQQQASKPEESRGAGE